MNALLRKYLRGDTVLWITFAGLCVMSVVFMYSASSTLAYKAMSHSAPVLRHASFLAVGALIAFVVHLIPYKYIRLFSYVMLGFAILTLVMVLMMGEKTNDASRWLTIMGVQFQPSELGKLSIIIVAADMIARMKISPKHEEKFFPILTGVLILVCGLIFPENFSTAVLLFGVVFLMMIIGSVSWLKLLKLSGGLLLALTLVIGVMEIAPQEKLPSFTDRYPTWKMRVIRFFVVEEDPALKYIINDENLQVQHGRIAIARGGLFGVMPGNSVQRDFLPQAYSDFIYAIIVEEIGLLGGISVILLYMILLFRAGHIATKSTTVFPAIVMIGLSLMIVLQAFISMSVATSLGPVTGQPLPMISRGGTSILITSIYFGIMFGITRQIKEEATNEKE
jgi:cell division protein FtsW